MLCVCVRVSVYVQAGRCVCVCVRVCLCFLFVFFLSWSVLFVLIWVVFLEERKNIKLDGKDLGGIGGRREEYMIKILFGIFKAKKLKLKMNINKNAQ